MATIGPLQTRAQTDAAIDRMMASWAENGFGLWCVELDGRVHRLHRAQPAVVRGRVHALRRSRLAAVARPSGVTATRRRPGEQRSTSGSTCVGLDEIVSFTAAVNHKSRRVMEKLGMSRDVGADFDHPSVPKGDPLRPHVLYRLSADQHHGVPSGS